MYMNYFGFDKPPFKITPDPEFFFPGGNRGAVLEALLYAVARGEGIVKVVGEVGSGKTMLCRMLERELPRDCEIVYLANPRLSSSEILHAIAIELGLDVPPGAGKVEITRRLHACLLEKHAADARVVMFIEEAQGMDVDTLEEIRLLSNLETTRDKLLQIVLFGQPELRQKLARHEIRQLRERITYAFDLAPLGAREVRDYVNTRLRATGYRGGELFTRGALRRLERHSAGLLRRINILADKALLAAFSRGDRRVEARHVAMAARDSEFRRGASLRPRWLLGLMVLGGLAGGGWWLGHSVVAAPRAPAAAAFSVVEPAVAVAAADVVAAPVRDAAPVAVPALPPSAVAGLIGLEALVPDTAPALGPEQLADWLRPGPPRIDNIQ